MAGANRGRKVQSENRKPDHRTAHKVVNSEVPSNGGASSNSANNCSSSSGGANASNTKEQTKVTGTSDTPPSHGCDKKRNGRVPDIHPVNHVTTAPPASEPAEKSEFSQVVKRSKRKKKKRDSTQSNISSSALGKDQIATIDATKSEPKSATGSSSQGSGSSSAKNRFSRVAGPRLPKR